MEELFKSLYNSEYQRIFRLCKGYFNANHELAHDATQEVFMKVWENLHTYRKEAQLTTWIYRIAINVCLSYARKASFRNEKNVNFPEVPAEFADAEQDYKLNKMYDCIQKLDDLNKSIVLMMLEGITYAEIATVIGIKEDTLRVKIHRIKQSLTQCVSK